MYYQHMKNVSNADMFTMYEVLTNMLRFLNVVSIILVHCFLVGLQCSDSSF